MERPDQAKKMEVLNTQFGERDGHHVSDAELVAFYHGQLLPEQSARVQTHLLDCLQCKQLFQEVRAFYVPPEAEEPLISQPQTQASWERLKARLTESALSAASRGGTRLRAAETERRSFAPGIGQRGWLALAASLVLLLLSVAIWRGQAGRMAPEVAQTSGRQSPLPQPTQTTTSQIVPTPEASAAASATVSEKSRATRRLPPVQGQTAESDYLAGVLRLTSGERSAGKASEPEVWQIPATARSFRLKLRKYNPLEFAAYQVVLLDASGAVQQSVIARIAKDKQLEVVFTTAGLSDGEYRVRATGLDAAGRIGSNTDVYEGSLKLAFPQR